MVPILFINYYRMRKNIIVCEQGVWYAFSMNDWNVWRFGKYSKIDCERIDY